ncbi:MAG: beta-ketoacyl synthase N-terminal-like domain-containing protein [Calothrix sp. MO_167.B12]|nr:beta-ketoacyl synthase N-terminal-like domain-containing protein [Calothrix sp. MO_167.B12]
MSADWMDTALSQLEEQINNCEQAVVRFIEDKKMKSDKSMSTDKINRKLHHNPIAIVGMASLFPEARNIQEYWENIVNKIDCITDVPASHWNVDDYYDPNPRTPEDKTYCKRGGFIPYVDFNPVEFGIPPNILEVTDVSQLLSLVVAKEAMADAGYGLERQFNRENVGVILGSAALKLGIPLSARLQYPIWKKVLKSSGLSDEDTEKIIEKMKSAYVKWDENSFPGMLANVIAGRIANRLNLGGINCTVDAACASSLAALKMAIGELVDHRCDMMLTGGVDTDNSITAYISFSKTPAVSPGDTVKPFDAESDGMMLGEGIGMMVLKRLEDAERDGDKIYAVIKGIGTSSDGRYKSIYAPRKEGQVAALRRAYEDADIAPETVTLMEAHGTGTMAGDPTEFGSLREFFGETDCKRQHIALGTVKSQIGHTKAAAGAASLIKTALALHHKVLPPTLNVKTPNPKLNLKDSSFYLNTETRPWIRAEGQSPRRAGVSSFGFGGTNYHVVLEEYQGEHEKAYRLNSSGSEVLLFADNPAQLVLKCEEILNQLQSEQGEKHYLNLVEACKSLEIPQTAARLGFVADSLAQACKLLKMSMDLLKNKSSAEAWEHPQGIYYRATGMELGGKVVALFSGQGSQYLEMGREVVMNFPQMRQMYGYMDGLLLQENLKPLSEVVFPHPVFTEEEKNNQVAALQRTEYAQPAIGMLSAGLYKILQQAGLKPDFVAGHSFGELTALWAAGVLTDEDYCLLVKARGQAMAAPQDPHYDTGTMLAVKSELSKVEAILKQFPQVAIANLNSPTQVVLAGPTAEIHRVRDVLHEQGCTAVLLPVAAAFHTPLIAFAQKSFAIAIKDMEFHTPRVPVYSNVTGKEYPQTAAEIQKILETHIANSVLFKQEIENIYGAGGYCFIEFGPRKILTNLVKDILGERPHMAIALNPSAQKDSDRSLRQAVVQLRVAGLCLQNLDPYYVPQSVPKQEQKKGLKFQLNGMNYVSDKTKLGFEQALGNGHQVKVLSNGKGSISPELVSLNGKNGVGKSSNERLTQRSHSVAEVSSVVANGVRGGAEGERRVESNGVGKSNHQELVQGTPDKEEVKMMEKNGVSPKVDSFQETGKAKITIADLEPTQLSQVSPTVSASVPSIPRLDMQSTEKVVGYQRILSSLEYVLTQFQQNQSENLQVHSNYLHHQVEYARSFFQLMQQQNVLFGKDESASNMAELKSTIIDSLNRSMQQFHSQQGDTLRVHEQYLREQVEYTKNFFQLLQQEYAQLMAVEDSGEVMVARELGLANPTPTVNQLPHTPPESKLTPVTPVAKLSPTTSAIEEKEKSVVAHPQVWESQGKSEVKNGATAVMEVVAAPTPTVGESETTVTVEETVAVNAQINIPVAEPVAVDLSNLSENLLAITSEKTGYPVEMLELDMDMEADLGIDSIKRVEIMGALQEMYPDLPKPENVEELGELRTIAQIVDYLQSLAAKSGSETTVTPGVETPTVSEPVIEPTIELTPLVEEVAVNHVTTPIEETVGEPVAVDLSNLSENLLAITSEKTGYPVEMLELDMDMEADLGIDSIKRVEIMGALQEMYPDLPKPDNVEELGELRTIAQIVDYLQQLATGEKKKSQPQSPSQSNQVKHNVKRLPAKLQTLPEPDFWDVTLPEGHIGLITDDGSLTTSKVAENLIERGWKVVVLSFPPSLVSQQSALPPGVNRITLQDLSETHLQQQLNAIATNYGNVGGFIHLHPVFGSKPNATVPYFPEEKAIVKHIFLMAKHLKGSLNQAANRNGRSCFCTVARLDGAFGLEQKVHFGAIGAGLFGLSKSMIWEWEKVFCRAMDISPDINAQDTAHHIIAELHDPNRYLTEVAYGSQGRVTLTA